MHREKLQRTQEFATRMVTELVSLGYEERMKIVRKSSLESRRERGDLIIDL